MATLAINNAIDGLSEGGTINVTAQQGVLATDVDPFGYLLAVSAVGNGSGTTSLSGGSAIIQGNYGTLTMHADGSYSYVAFRNISLPADGVVQDKFTFSVTDGHGNTGQATLAITVTQPGMRYIAAAAGQTITIGNAPTVVDASLGNVTVRGGNGNDVIIGGANDTITLGNGNDAILGGTSEKITLGNGNDTVAIGAGGSISAGNGNDAITAGSASNVAVGNGNDTVTAGNRSSITGGNGNDVLTAGSNATIKAGNGVDQVSAGTGSTETVGALGVVSPALSAPASLSVQEDGSVALPITVSSGIPSATLAVRITGIPADASLSNAGGPLTVTNGIIVLTPAQLAGLTLKAGEVTSATLVITATATAGGTSASISDTSTLTVNPVAPALTLTSHSLSVPAGGTVLLGIGETPFDPRDTVSITITGVPVDATLSAGTKNGNGTWTLAPAQLPGLSLKAGAATVSDLTVTATNTQGQTASSSQSIALTVTPAASILTIANPVLSVGEGATIGLGITVSGGAGGPVAITIMGVPADASLSAGTKNSDGSWSLTAAQLSGLTLTAGEDHASPVTLTVTAAAANALAYATVDDPGEAQTQLWGVNNAGLMVGAGLDAPVDVGGPVHSFIAPATNFDVNGSTFSTALAVNDSGVLAGGSPNAAYLGTIGHFTTILQAFGATATGVNDAGVSVAIANGSAFIDNGGQLSPVTVNGASSISWIAINNLGQIAGTANGGAFSFIGAAGGPYQTLALPGGYVVQGFNKYDQIVGYQLGAGGLGDGFLMDTNGTVYQIDIPGAAGTRAEGISDNGDIVGTYYDAGHNEHGFHTTVAAVEAGAALASQSIALSITPVPEAPKLTFASPTVSVGEGGTVGLGIGVAGDADDTIAVTLAGVPSGATLSAGANNGNGSWTLTAAQVNAGVSLIAGEDLPSPAMLSVTATNTTAGEAASSSGSIALSITPTPEAPKLTIANPTLSVAEDGTIGLGIGVAGDADDTIAITIAGVPGDATLSAGVNVGNGTWALTTAQVNAGLSLTAGEDAPSPVTLSVTATNTTTGETASSTGSIALSITGTPEPPALTIASSTLSVAEGGLIGLGIGVVGDADDTISVTVAGVPSGATLSAGVNNGNGNWTLTSAEVNAGASLTAGEDLPNPVTLSVTATNTATGEVASSSGDIALSITPAPEPPTLSIATPVLAVPENGTVGLGITVAGDADDAISVTIAGVPSGATLSAGVNNGNGSWTLTAAQVNAGISLIAGGNLTSPETLSVTATNTTTGEMASASSNIALSITPTPEPPTLSIASPTLSVPEDGTVGLGITVAGDADDMISVTIAGVPGDATLSAGVNGGNGSWTLTAAQVDAGVSLTAGEDPVTLSVTATNTATGAVASSSGSLALSITPVPEPPALTIASPTLSVPEDGTVGLGIGVAGDADDTISVTIAGVPSDATLSAGVNNGDGSWTLSADDVNSGVSLTAGEDLPNPVTLSVTATNTATGETASSSGSIAVAVTPTSEAPGLTVPGAIVLGEGASAPLDIGVSQSDSDDTLGTVMITGLPSDVMLSAGTNDGAGTWTLAQTDLAGLQITAGQTPGTVLVTVTTSAGEDGLPPAAASQTFTLSIGSVAGNQAPVVTVPGQQAVGHHAVLAFNNNVVSVNDPDGDLLTVSLSVTHGTLHLAQTSGVQITGGANNSGNVELYGSAAAINAALNGMIFTPDPAHLRSILLVSASDGIFTGLGSVAIQVNDHAPTITVPTLSPPGAPLAAEANQTLTFNGSIQVADADGDTLGVSLKAASGKLLLAQTGGIQITGGANNSSQVQIQGTAAAINAALNGLAYTPNANFFGTDSITIAAGDGVLSALNSIPILVTDFPPANQVPAAQTLVGANPQLVFSSFGGNPITVGDVNQVPLTVTLSVAHGALALASDAGIQVIGGGFLMVLTGLQSAINTALDGLTYTPDNGFVGADTLSLTTSNGISGATSSVAIQITDHAPVISAPSDNQVASANQPLTLSSNISVADPDSDPLTVTLGVTKGTLQLGSTAGVAITSGADNTANVQLYGSAAAISAALSSLTYTSANFIGNDTLSITASDGVYMAEKSVPIAVFDATALQLTVPPTQLFSGPITLTGFATGGPSGLKNQQLTMTIDVFNGVLGFAGTLTVTPVGDATVTGNGTGTVTIKGSADAINEVIGGGVLYTPPDSAVTPASYTFNNVMNILVPIFNGPVTNALQVSVTDGTENWYADSNLISAPWEAAVLLPSEPTHPHRTDVDLTPPTVDLASTNQIVETNQTLTFGATINNGITVGDDDGYVTQVTLSVLHGTLRLAPSSSLNVTGNGTGSITITGNFQVTVVGPTGLNITYPAIQLSDINGALDGLTYTPNQNFTGSDTLVVNALDTGYGATGDASVAIQVGDAAPAIIVPTVNGLTGTNQQTVHFNSALVFGSAGNNAISVDDPDSSAPQNVTLTVSLSVHNGTLALAQSDGLEVTITDFPGPSGLPGVPGLPYTVKVTGSIAAINAALNGLTYTPNTNYVGADTLVVTASDGVSTTTSTSSVPIEVDDNAPANIVPAEQSVESAHTLVFPGTISVNDVDGDPLTAELSVVHGTLQLSQNAAVDIIAGFNGASSMEIGGSVADIDTALNGLSYTAAPTFAGVDTLSLTTSDGVYAATSTVAISVGDQAPAIAVPHQQTVAAPNRRLKFSSGNGNAITVSDPAGDPLTVDVTVANGTLQLGTEAGIQIVGGADNSPNIDIQGSQSAVNAALNGLTYTPDLSHRADGLTIQATASGVSVFESVAIEVNDNAPVNTVPLQQQTVQGSQPLVFGTATGNAISVADLDGGNLSVTLSVANGTLSLVSTSGISITAGADGTNMIQIRGPIASINTDLDGLTYTPGATFQGFDTLSIATSDGSYVTESSVAIDPVPHMSADWTNAAGGEWNDAANWSTGAVPGAADGILINLPPSATVSVDGGGNAAAGQLANSGGSLDIANASLVVGGPVSNSGAIEVGQGGAMLVQGNVDSSGTLTAAGGNLTVSGALSGGNTTVAGGTVEIGGPSDTTVTFAVAQAAATCKLDDSQDFSGQISGWAPGDVLGLADIGFSAATAVSYLANGSNTGGILSLTDGIHTANIALLGQYAAASFAAASDGHGGTLVSDPAGTGPAQLAQPHA